ncbi:MAG: hypothetical protein ACSHX4_02065 [Opitutaceae bacterium]
MTNFKLPAWNVVPFTSNVSALFLAGAVALAFFIPTAQAQEDASAILSRTQTIELTAGWNAVYLELEPLDSTPTDLFDGTPIEIVAGYFRPVTAMEYIDSPSDVLPDRKGWNVWYAPERDDALLSDLYQIQAHHAYLIYTEEDYTWNLVGTPFYDTVNWFPNAYSLVGFHVNAAEQPSIANFFENAEAHTPLKIYKMISGRWSLVTNPESTLIEPGVAYWAYSEGASDFSGPLKVTFADESSGGLRFTDYVDTVRIVISNTSIYPQHLTITQQPGSNGSVPLAYVARVGNGPNNTLEPVSIPLPQTLQLGPLEAGQAFALTLEVVREQLNTAVTSSSLSIASDAGVIAELPVISIRSDLLQP